MRLWIFYSMLFCCVLQSQAQQVSATAELNNKEYLIGDYIRMNISVSDTGTAIIQWPDVRSIVSDFEFISASAIDTLHTKSNTTYSQEIVFSIYDSGFYKLQPIDVYYKLKKDTNNYLAQTDSISLFIHTINVDTTQAIKPIKSITEVSVKNYLPFYIAGGVLLLAMLTWLFVRYFKKKKKEPKEEPLTPHSLYELTFEKLQTLDHKKLWQQEPVSGESTGTKLYYIELTEIIREYIEHRFKLPALESTSDEIIELLVKAGVNIKQIEHINSILLLADLAKFAKSKPLPEENILSMEYSKEFVETTKETESEIKEAGK